MQANSPSHHIVHPFNLIKCDKRHVVRMLKSGDSEEKKLFGFKEIYG